MLKKQYQQFHFNSKTLLIYRSKLSIQSLYLLIIIFSLFNVYVRFHFIQVLLNRIINLINFQTIIVSLKYRVRKREKYREKAGPGRGFNIIVRYDLNIWPSILVKGHCLPFKLNMTRKRHFLPLFSYIANISTTNI